MAEQSEKKLKEADKMVKKADKMTILSFTNWAADWAQATPLYEQAERPVVTISHVAYPQWDNSLWIQHLALQGLAFKLAKQTGRAKHCFEKAATGQERLSSQWTAAKHLETAGQLAKELEDWAEVKDLYKRASELYMYCGKPQPAADALVRGARAIEDKDSDSAVHMYIDSCSMLEEDGREQMAFDTYRAATNLFIKLKRFSDAASMLLRWGQAADKCKANQSLCKAYVGAIIVYLYAGDRKGAQQCFNDCSQVDAFLNSDQNMLAESLLKAYRENDGEEIMYIVKSSKVIPHLDHMIVRLAKQLPSSPMQRGVGTSSQDPSDDLDEDDLT